MLCVVIEANIDIEVAKDIDRMMCNEDLLIEKRHLETDRHSARKDEDLFIEQIFRSRQRQCKK